MNNVLFSLLCLIVIGCSTNDRIIEPIQPGSIDNDTIANWFFNGDLKDETVYGHHLTGVNISDSLYQICPITGAPEALELFGPAGTEKITTTQYAMRDDHLSTLFEVETSNFDIIARVAIFEERGHLFNKYDHTNLYGWSVQFNGWQLTLVLGNGTQQVYQTGVVITDSLFHDYRIEVKRNENQAWFYIDDSLTLNSPVDISSSAGSLNSPTPSDLMVGLIATSGPFEGAMAEITFLRPGYGSRK